MKRVMTAEQVVQDGRLSLRRLSHEEGQKSTPYRKRWAVFWGTAFAIREHIVNV